jgi:hypothetical protein
MAGRSGSCSSGRTAEPWPSTEPEVEAAGIEPAQHFNRSALLERRELLPRLAGNHEIKAGSSYFDPDASTA